MSQDKRNVDIQREFIAAMRRGLNISEACRELGIKRDGKLKYLRKRYPEFSRLVEEIKYGVNQSPESYGSFGTPEKEWGSDFDGDSRIESFLVTYRETQDLDSSARASGFLPTTVEKMMDPTSEKFHAEFARAMREEEIRKGWRIRNDLERQAEAGDAVSQRWWLERRLPDFTQRAKGSTESNDNKFTQEVLLKTMEKMSALMAEIRKQAVPADEPEIPADESELAN